MDKLTYKIIEDYVDRYYMYIANYYYDETIIHVKDSFKNGDVKTTTFKIDPTYRSRGNKEVTIKVKGFSIISSKCDCHEFDIHRKCEHVAACLLYYNDAVFDIDEKDKSLFLTRHLLNAFYEEPSSKGKRLHKQIHLEAELHFDYEANSIRLVLKIGEDKLYSLNSKLTSFTQSYIREEPLSFGKSFTYEPDVHYFSSEDEEFLNFIIAGYSNLKDIYLDIRTIKPLLSILKNRRFTVFYKNKVGIVTKIVNGSPLKMELSKEDEETYKLSIAKDTLDCVLLEIGQFAYKDGTLYILPKKLSDIVYNIQEYELESLYFKKEDLDLFKNSVLPAVKSEVEVSSELSSEIAIGSKPMPKIYLDFKDYLLLLTYKLDYQGTEIDYFDKHSNIIRDDETEETYLKEIIKYGFKLENDKIYMDDIDIIGDFLENELENLAGKYDVFSSAKIKNTNFIRNSHITSTFHLGKDNIMKYSFDLGDISENEIVNILGEMKKKKKYYKLKSGDFINLEENEDLRELSALVDDLELSDRDIKNGTGSIPKYRAIYLDSIKKDKYHIISTDNLFDELIDKFNSYKDVSLKLSKKDKNILRDYQEVGVKWLYNIYKCGFGGILADEMGLGKSIQLIYFIKAIIKEKKDAKILIVSPTSLVYNWQAEFEKFGSEISYKVFAENKEIRKKELEHLDDTNVLITTYGLIRRDKDMYEGIDFEVVAIDEAQNIKNINAQMTKAVKNLNAAMKVALTGTPLENSVMELWSIFDFIMPGYLASTLSFQRKYNIKDVDEKNLEVLNTLESQIRPFILRRKKKDVVKELPDKIENNIFIDLDSEQKKLYVAQLEKTQKEMDELIKEEGFTKASFKILQLLTKLRELCIDPRLLYDNYKGSSAKIENLISLTKDIIKNGHKILLFSSYKKAIDLVNLEFTNNNISTYVIDGSVPAKKRMELVNKFNTDDTNVFLITLKSGGTGLNLTSADVVIHLDLWWNPQVENQATDRAHRIGQKNTVEVIKMICKGTIEERILELQNKKKILSEKLIEGDSRDENIISKLTEQDIKNLLSLDNKDE